MKFVRSILSVAVAAAFSVACLAQQPATGYHTVACLKVKADKGTEFRKWAGEDLHKYSQSRVDSGAITTWYLLRSVIPQGESAECDYLIVAMYPAAPPKPLGVEELGAAFNPSTGWKVAAIEPDRVQTRYHDDGAPAWLATIKRI